MRVVALRNEILAGPITLGALLSMPASTAGKILRRNGCSRRERPPAKVYPRYEREVPGDLIHIDVKRLGRFFTPGKYLHVAIDDHTRMAYAQVMTGQGKAASCAFLERSLSWFEEHLHTRVRQVMTDNGHAYRSCDWRDRCEARGITHIGTSLIWFRGPDHLDRFAVVTSRSVASPHEGESRNVVRWLTVAGDQWLDPYR